MTGIVSDLVVGLMPASPSNYSRVHMFKVDLLVIHTMEGVGRPLTVYEAGRLFQGELEKRRSYHYGIAEDGTIIQFVPIDACAWHCGNKVYNNRSIGVAMEGICDREDWLKNTAYSSLLALSRKLVQKYGIPVDRKHVIGHGDVPNPDDPTKYGGKSGHHDPGKFFPWDRFLSDLGNGGVT